MARPSKWSKDIRRQCELMAKRGWTDAQMAELIGVDVSTFDKWKRKYKTFFQSLKDWKKIADSKVEKTLYERAIGFKCPEDKIFNHNGEPLIVPTTKHYPPDTTAIIFWLKNRDKQNWRDVHDRRNITDYDGMSDDELDEEIKQLTKKLKS